MNSQEHIAVEVSVPGQVSAERRALFMQRVREGGEVNPHSLRRLVDRAFVLGLALRGQDLVGVGGIKRPNAAYRDRIFASAGAAQDPAEFEFELGWIYVVPAARSQHVSTRLVETLMRNIGDGQVYATSHVNNERVHALLDRFDFAAVGKPYRSKLNEPDIQLFVHKRRVDGPRLQAHKSTAT